MVDNKDYPNKMNVLLNIKSHYILNIIFNNLVEFKSLNIIRYNKKLQNKSDKDINIYREYSKIEIDIIPILDDSYKNRGLVINIPNEKDKQYFHLYLNGNTEEMKRNYFTREDNAKKIKIIIDPEIISFFQLFKLCEISEVNFIKFNRNDINNMDSMFYECYYLNDIKFTKFNSKNVTNMSSMFYGCHKLKSLNLNNFNTSNVTDMSYMFSGCSKLVELNLLTIKV